MKQHIPWIAALAITSLSACGQEKVPTPQDIDRSQEVAGDSTELTESETDSATERWKARWAWYNDDAPYAPSQKGHAFSRKYMQFLNGVAAQERARYGSKIPLVTRTSAADGTIVTKLRPAGQDPARVSGTTWVNIGPTTATVEKNGSYTIPGVDAGRVATIVPHPTSASTLYVAFAAAGVWKTTDGGTTWTALTESLGSLSCGWLEMDPNNPQTLYLGLGDAFDGTGIGLVKSTDGGATWSSPVYLGASTQIRQVTVAPGNSSIVLAATDAGLYRSTNAGASFSQVSLATGQAGNPAIWTIAWTGGSGFALTLEAAPAATSGTTDGQAWYSADNGASWTRATGFTKTSGIGRAALASAPSARGTLYAYAAIPLSSSASDLADMFKSTNGGQTWTALAVTAKKYTNAKTTGVSALLNGQGWYNQVVIVHPTNPSVAFFGGALTLARTSDGGSTFYKMSDWLSAPYVHADMHAAAFDAAGALYIGSDGGTFKSTNSTAASPTFSHLNNGLVTHLFYSVGSSLANPNAVIGGLQDNGTRVRVGATGTFNQYIGGDGFGADIHPLNANTMLGSLYYARIQKSTDGGTTWTSACSGITECNNSSTAPFNTKIVPWAGDASGNTVYTFSNTKVYRSTNYAGTWSAVGTAPTDGAATLSIRNFGVAATDANRIGVVTSGGRIFTSTNAGATWRLVLPPNNGLSLSYLWYDSTNANIVYVASVAADSTRNHLWRSTDGGLTFAALDGGGFPFGVPVNAIRNDPTDPAHLFAGTHHGIYESSDGGLNWTRFGSGLPLVEVADFYIAPDSSLMRIATFGRGIWQLQ
ncbi:MAG TPA: hypothetical protein VNO30_36170 [Kofleriaceae bacterium]|nr:hypothetical protein [Kofleriaceae bacterium]